MTTDLLADLESLMTEGSAEMVKFQSHPLGNSAKVVVYPKTEDEIVKVLSYANENKKTVSVIGGGTKRGFGGTEAIYDILISMEDYKGISVHSPEEHLITVKAGTPFAEIQRYLETFNQKLAFDPFFPEDATIGGIIATNDNGPKRLGYGAIRDAVTGFRVVCPNGFVSRFGGTEKKNGCAMNKLYIGSMGTLGILTEITLKTRPLPLCEHLVLMMFYEERLEEVQAVARKISDSLPELTALELLTPALTARMLGRNCYSLAISFEGERNDVLSREKIVKKLKPAHAGLVIFEEETARNFWGNFYRIRPNGKQQEFDKAASLKIGVERMEVWKILRETERIRNKRGVHVEGHGSFGTGICHVYVWGTMTELKEIILLLKKAVLLFNGYVIINHLALSLRRKINVWGELPSFFYLVYSIKSEVDPNRVLNPKRFAGGI